MRCTVKRFNGISKNHGLKAFLEMISIIGSGRVGSTVGMILVQRNIDDVNFVDIIPGLPEGEALRISVTWLQN